MAWLEPWRGELWGLLCGGGFFGSRLWEPEVLKDPNVECPLAHECGIPGCEGVCPGSLQPLCVLSTPSTILVEPGCQAEMIKTGDIRISVGAEAPSTVGTKLDPIQLSIFSHRFMSIAGEWPCLSSPQTSCIGALHTRQMRELIALAPLTRSGMKGVYQGKA